MPRPIPLSGPYVSRYGAPTIAAVDPRVFRLRYFTHCLSCTFCGDWCCQEGVDVDQMHYAAIMAHADPLEAYLAIPRERWFTGEVDEDDEVPGGASYRTAVVDGACVFLNRSGRGCRLHAFCLEDGIDYHDLKSMVDCLFPLTFGGHRLSVADEVIDGSLVCLETGPTIYRGLRSELEYYFGDGFVRELDAAEALVLRRGARRQPAPFGGTRSSTR
jgi:hypothetical protein